MQDSPLFQKLLQLGHEHSHNDDVSHDFYHIQRVLHNAEKIILGEGGDMDILLPACLFHDVVNYPKNDPRADQSSNESAIWTAELLQSIPEYPQEKIEAVADAISKCSFSKGIVPDLLESKILQDADGLESVGAISIARTFASTGLMQRPFYNPEDPFCENHDPNPREFALDLFYKRLFKVYERFHTQTARDIAKQRHDFLQIFIDQLHQEIS